MIEAIENGLDPKACFEQVDRLTSSSVLRGSDAHCRLIRYLAALALNSPSRHVKEYQIATEALGRPTEFDPHSDASVRVQIARLRDKLAEYYSSVGSHDAILIEIPKGRYTLTFRNKPPGEEEHSPVEPILDLPPGRVPDPPQASSHSQRFPIATLSVLAGILALLVISIVFFRHREAAHSHDSASNVATQPQSALAIFWGPFVHAQEEPFVVFRNRTLIGNLDTGMRRFDPSRDNPNQQVQRYTGIGEVMGVVELARVFRHFESDFLVKPDSLFTIDDAREANLILLGAPDEAPNLKGLPGTTHFFITRLENGPESRRAIIDSHPASGSASVYARSFGKEGIETDYAIVALKRGLDPSHWTLLFEGTSSVATQAAVDYTCSDRSVSGLLNQLHLSNSAALKPFEGLLRVKIAHDVPMETELLMLRETKE